MKNLLNEWALKDCVKSVDGKELVKFNFEKPRDALDFLITLRKANKLEYVAEIQVNSVTIELDTSENWEKIDDKNAQHTRRAESSKPAGEPADRAE